MIWQRFCRLGLVGLVAAGVLASASAASAAITPSVSSSSPGAVTAGATGSLGLNLTFSPTGTDTPKDLTLNLPPGLLANAAIDDGGCLQTTDIQTSTCQVGSGTVVANLGGAALGVPTPVSFFLVPPPSPNDLAGLAVAEAGEQIGATAPIVIRPSGDPDGVGVTIDLVLPNTLDGIALQITAIDSTFSGLRFPTTCPSTPAQVTISADSYADPTVKSSQTPLPVTGCSSLTYQPKYTLSVVRDSGDRVDKLSTEITQGPTESPSSSIVLAFPSDVIAPSLGGLSNLCSTGVASGTCTPVGSVTAVSPLYPKPLTGQAYLTGQTSDIAGLTLTLAFPPPFPLTLVGKVDLANVSTTFTGLPDIPLTNLGVTLNGGPTGLFASLCATQTGTSTATLTDQNGDKTVSDPASFTVSGCPAGSAGAGSGSGGSGGSGAGGTKVGKPQIRGATLTGLTTGKPALSFTATAGTNAPNLATLTVSVPKGLKMIARRVHGKRLVAVGIKGAKLKSATLSDGKLLIALGKPAGKVSVTLKALRESAALKAKAKHKQLKGVKLTVIVHDAHGKRTAAHVAVTLKR